MRPILIACFLLLSACGVAPAPTATPQPSPTTAPTATPIPPTATAIPPTATPIPPTATPAPTATPRPTATPLPTATPKPENTPIVISGKGDDVVNVNKWAGFAVMRVTATGASNFIVHGINRAGDTDFLINTIGNYSGIVLLDTYDSDQTTRLEIKSAGSWKFEILPMGELVKTAVSVCPDCNGAYTGKGDDVVMIFAKDGYTTDLLTIEAPNASRNFIVHSIDRSGDMGFLVNKIAPYSGKTILPRDTIFLIVKATGPWKATITAK